MSFKSVVKENAKVSAGGILWKYLVIQTPFIETSNFHYHLTWQNDPWRIEVFGAYGFRDERFKYGVSGKWLLDRKSRLIVFGGNRRDVEQTGASLTSSNDVLGRNLASSVVYVYFTM